MTTATKLTAQYLGSCPYPEFVGLINQTNVPPGAHATCAQWRVFSGLTATSALLEVACSTGFNSRELVRTSQCEGVGFDLSAPAIAAANRNIEAYRPGIRLHYQVADGGEFQPGRRFSHVVVGASLGFFPDPELMLRRCVDWLEDGGYLLAAEFVADKPIGERARQVRRQEFGITSEQPSTAQALQLYQGLSLVHLDRQPLTPEPEADIEEYCAATVQRFARESGTSDSVTLAAVHERLRRIRRATNVLREVQQYLVLVYRLDRAEYPNRYTERFW
jgi:SAM-dependent methyltransferase